jgi:hypothetical protein
MLSGTWGKAGMVRSPDASVDARAREGWQAPEALVRWQLRLLFALERLDAKVLIARYFELNRGRWLAHSALFQTAESAFRSRGRLPLSLAANGDGEGATSQTFARLPNPSASGEFYTGLAEWAARAGDALEQFETWIELSDLAQSHARRELSEFALAEALCAARGDEFAIRSLCTRLGLPDAHALARHFSETGHVALADWLVAE